MENKQLTLTDYADIKQEIRNSMGEIVSNFCKSGFYLKKIRDEKLYLEDGYKDIWEMAQSEYNLSRTVTSRFMAINDRYSIGGNSPELQEQFKGFGKSALTEMLNLPVEDYELITPDTKIEDIRELKEAERQNQEEQVEGQMSLVKDMPEVVPDADKPEKKEISISEVLRDLFRPREMKEFLDQLVNMDPDSTALEWWVNDFYSTKSRTFKRFPYFLFFSKDEGIKIKNIARGTIEPKTYKEFYFMVRAAFGQETARGTDVWMQAFGEEWEEQQKQEKEAEERAKKQSTQKKQDKKPKNLDFIKREPDSGKPEKAPETTENRSEEFAETSQEEKNTPKEPQKEGEKGPENLDFLQCEADSPKQPKETDHTEAITGEVEKTVCDIAQGYTVTFPVKPGEYMYKIAPASSNGKRITEYKISLLPVYMYEVRRHHIVIRYHEENDSKEISYKPDRLWDILTKQRIFASKDEAEKEIEKLNGKK